MHVYITDSNFQNISRVYVLSSYFIMSELPSSDVINFLGWVPFRIYVLNGLSISYIERMKLETPYFIHNLATYM